MTNDRTLTRWAVTALVLGWLGQAAAQANPPIVDRDSDGLIEINNLDDLNEVRNDLMGRTLRGSSAGCPASGCFGYELTRDLDFDTNGNGSLDAGDWNVGRSWTPIQGTRTGVPLEENRFRAEFNGNGHTIRTLRLRQITNVHDYGLFGAVTNAFIRDLRLSGVDANVFGSIPAKVIAAVLNDFKPNIEAQRRFIARWSCSMMLLRQRQQRTSTDFHLGSV